MATSGGGARATIARWRALTAEAPDRAPRVLVVSSFTSQPIAPALGATLHDATGQTAMIGFADYNQLFQVCLEPELHGASDADEVVLIWRIEDVFERDLHAWGEARLPHPIDCSTPPRSLGAAVAGLAATIAGSVMVSDSPTRSDSVSIIETPSYSLASANSSRRSTEPLTRPWVTPRVDPLRLAALQHAEGTVASFDRRNWLMYRQPFTEAFALQVGAAVADVVAARDPRASQGAGTDCDDTLWAGIIADDGIGSLQCSDAFPVRSPFVSVRPPAAPPSRGAAGTRQAE